MNKKIIQLFSLLSVFFVAIIILSNNIAYGANDKNEIVIVQDGTNKINVYIGAKEEASIASFQIGLSLDCENVSNIKFEWDNSLGKAELKEYTLNDDKSELNIYYVSKNEQNIHSDNLIKVGSISFSAVSGKVATINVEVVPENCSASSISHIPTQLEASESNELSTSINPTKTTTKKNNKTKHNGKLYIEPWMTENENLSKLAIDLRSEPYANYKINKNVYQLDEKVIYYINYKNGGKDVDKALKIQLKLPIDFEVIESDGATISKSEKTLTWSFEDIENGECGRKKVVLAYKKLSSETNEYERITPRASIIIGGSEKDVSSVCNYIVTAYNTAISEEHKPYMYGDAGTGKFRPDDTITRAEGALILTRVFGYDKEYYDITQSNFTDLKDTYPEARNAIVAATENGLVEGYPDGTYRPNNTMTRGEFITILSRQIEKKLGKGFEIKEKESLVKLYKETTTAETNHWSTIYATLLARLNMTDLSSTENKLRLNETITRAEVARLVNYCLLRIPANSSAENLFVDVTPEHKLYGDILEATRASHNLYISNDGKEL